MSRSFSDVRRLHQVSTAPAADSLSPNLDSIEADRDARGSEVVVVLGMHRSGTSAVAGALVAAGAWAGEPDELMPPHPQNPFGYFERTSTAAALDALLHELGGTWSSPPLDNLHESALEPHRVVLESLISDVVARAPAGALPLVKDPRLCLFASQLAAFLEDTSKVILCVRHPVEVARSLLERDSIPIQVGLALWELYNVSVCSGFAERAIKIVRYDQLLDDPNVISGVLGQTLAVKDHVPQNAYEAAAQSLSQGLRHQRVAVGDEEAWMSLSVARLWQRLSDAAQSPGAPPLEHATLSRASRELLVTGDELHGVLSQRESLARDLEEARATNGGLSDELSQLRDELHGVLSQRESLARDLEEARATNGGLSDELSQLRDELHGVLSQRESLARDLEEARATNGGLSDELSQLRDELHGVLSQRESLIRQFARARAVIERLATELDKQERALRTSLMERTRMRDELSAQLRQAQRQRDRALIDRDVAANALADLHGHADELSENAAAYLERSRHLEAKLTRIEDELGSTVAELTSVRDLREQLAVDLEQKNEELADALHRSLVVSDHARGFVESLRSVVGDFNPDAALDSLDEKELVTWVTLTSHERERLRDANATLLNELDAVNRHREELVDDLTDIWDSESWKIGRALTWPARFVLRRRPNRSDNRDLENAGEEENSLGN